MALYRKTNKKYIEIDNHEYNWINNGIYVIQNNTSQITRLSYINELIPGIKIPMRDRIKMYNLACGLNTLLYKTNESNNDIINFIVFHCINIEPTPIKLKEHTCNLVQLEQLFYKDSISKRYVPNALEINRHYSLDDGVWDIDVRDRTITKIDVLDEKPFYLNVPSKELKKEIKKELSNRSPLNTFETITFILSKLYE